VDFRLRDYRKQDFERLWAIDQACFPPGISYSRFELMSYIKRRSAFTIVGERTGERDESQAPKTGSVEALASHVSKTTKLGATTADIVGFIVTEVGRRAGHIITIDVLEEMRGTGLGSRLLFISEERLRKAGCQVVYLEAAVDNRGALAFYKRHGYFLLKTIPRYYSNGVDAFVLKKDLVADVVRG
jgi:[ribosomal protein S18]-alanine N-acetyltransferase